MKKIINTIKKSNIHRRIIKNNYIKINSKISEKKNWTHDKKYRNNKKTWEVNNKQNK
jgi:hypothetical protein